MLRGFLVCAKGMTENRSRTTCLHILSGSCRKKCLFFHEESRRELICTAMQLYVLAVSICP